MHFHHIVLAKKKPNDFKCIIDSIVAIKITVNLASCDCEVGFVIKLCFCFFLLRDNGLSSVALKDIL